MHKAMNEVSEAEDSPEDIYDIQAYVNKDNKSTLSTNLTFAFGHACGTGFQELLSGVPLERVVFNTALRWNVPLLLENTKQKKSFWEAVIALQKFAHLQASGYLNDWELVQFNGRPALELSFKIYLPNGYKLRGSVDAVLRNRITGEVRVLEIKTSSARYLDSATYKNSEQALGYSVVLDVLFPELSSYEVLYLPYLTVSRDFVPMSFKKSKVQRALWLKELLLDTEVITMYSKADCFPMHGESCYTWSRPCQYINTCTLPTASLINELTEEEAAASDHMKHFDVEVSFLDLIKSQLATTL